MGHQPLMDTHSVRHIHTRIPAKPFSNQLSWRALMQLEKWSGIAGVSYLSAVSWQVFSSSSLTWVQCLTRDHLVDMDRSSDDGCVNSQSTVLISQAHLWVECRPTRPAVHCEAGSAGWECKNNTELWAQTTYSVLFYTSLNYIIL